MLFSHEQDDIFHPHVRAASAVNWRPLHPAGPRDPHVHARPAQCSLVYTVIIVKIATARQFTLIEIKWNARRSLDVLSISPCGLIKGEKLRVKRNFIGRNMACATCIVIYTGLRALTHSNCLYGDSVCQGGHCGCPGLGCGSGEQDTWPAGMVWRCVGGKRTEGSLPLGAKLNTHQFQPDAHRAGRGVPN